jgi:hypothetical protein
MATIVKKSFQSIIQTAVNQTNATDIIINTNFVAEKFFILIS